MQNAKCKMIGYKTEIYDFSFSESCRMSDSILNFQFSILNLIERLLFLIKN